MSSYPVRPATQRESKAIAEIQIQSAHQAMPGLHGDDYLASASVDKRQAFWRDAIEFSEPQVLVALAGETAGAAMVGFVGFDRSRDKGTPPTMGEIWALYVAPTHWNEGVGLALWDAAREGLLEEGCTQVTLWLALDNVRALRFFELAGFKRELNTARVAAVGGIKVQEIRLKRTLG